MLCPFYPFLVFFRQLLDVWIFCTTTFLKNRAGGTRKTRRIDPRTPEAPES